VRELATDHFPLLVFHALLIAWFLALLWKERGERKGFFLRVFGGLVGASTAIAWLLAAAGGARR
jgi:hypothetical protein